MTATNMCSIFGGKWDSPPSDSSKITYPAGLDPPQKIYQPLIF